jgi:hypothetical protein
LSTSSVPISYFIRSPLPLLPFPTPTSSVPNSRNSSARLGCLKGGSRDIKSHDWFSAPDPDYDYGTDDEESDEEGDEDEIGPSDWGSAIDWVVLRTKATPAPWVPSIKDPLDASNFADRDEEPDGEGVPYKDDGSNWDAGF